MNLASFDWKLKENRKIEGDGYYLFPSSFSKTICVLGVTTNLNPRNVVGYIHQVIRVPVLGGDVELGERFTLTNKYPRIIIYQDVSPIYYVRFRFAMPLGNCQVKIWESMNE